MIKGGDLVQEFVPRLVVPLFFDALNTELWRKLPRFESNGIASTRSFDESLIKGFDIQLFLSQHAKSEPRLLDSIVASLWIISNGKLNELLNNEQDSLSEATDVADPSDDIVDDTWLDREKAYKYAAKYASAICKRSVWRRLVLVVYKQIHVVSVQHPLHQYATSIIPSLRKDEAESVRELLGCKATQSVLGLIKQIQDAHQPWRLAVILDPNVDLTHSCIPTAQLELVNNNGQYTAQLKAVYDTTVPAVDVSSGSDLAVDERESLMERVRGGSCGCLRCCYEADETFDLSIDDCLSLGRHYMANENFTSARSMYQRAVDADSNCCEAWHALGAIELSEGRFLEAQRVWRRSEDACSTDDVKRHPGLSLQREQLQCYRYLDKTESGVLPAHITWKKLFSNAFVASVLDTEVCQQVIQWAHMGTWTKKRHYAVPTHDVAVHTVAPLLVWFNAWMKETICPLLAHQFDTTPHFYVHDAFCVRYQASETSNYLPLHEDESTHSLVLALNEEYEGGGTYFAGPDQLVKLRTGEVLTFGGRGMGHGGEVVTKGDRYILAVFMYYDADNTTSDTTRGKTNGSAEIREAACLTDADEPASKKQKMQFSFNFDVGA
jgi:hypothetical protein